MIKKYQPPRFSRWYSGKTVLITGSTGGIGREFSRQLNECGARLLLCGRDKSAMNSLMNELQTKASFPIEHFLGDLSDKNAFHKIINSIQQKYKVDILVNNAGFGYINDFINMSSDNIASMIEVNCAVMANLCRSFIPQMKGRAGTGMLNVGSLASFFPVPGSALYGATKHFVLGFNDALHQELRSFGVHVSGVYPGITESKFHERASNGKITQVPGAMSAAIVVQAALQGLSENKLKIIPGLSNHMKLMIAACMPRTMQLRISYANSQKRNQSK
ncbi:MAG: SDR family NAD(P)-dependent oxidoreductase [Candidatus Omnitrophica bacterium]|nr:SDR family NAD(P)-dependent oxidoreductase [Candidatus Omnitrophota bacterium]MCB9747281.1 SDR family NAD(P)-dependent oxidoreductase [Candidatus Omnitrophota bacterium]